MHNLELVYWKENGESIELPLEDWQYAVIIQVLGLTLQEYADSATLSYFPKEFVMERVKKMGVLVPVEDYWMNRPN